MLGLNLINVFFFEHACNIGIVGMWDLGRGNLAETTPACMHAIYYYITLYCWNTQISCENLSLVCTIIFIRP